MKQKELFFQYYRFSTCVDANNDIKESIKDIQQTVQSTLYEHSRACRFAHLGRHLPSQSISHKHMAISQECSQRLRISLRYACKYLTCRKFEKNTGMFSILLSLKRWFIRFKPNFS